jgi:hypothetical protein
MSEQRIRKTEAIPSFDRLPLNALRVFEAVAIRLRFAAADALHMTPAAGHSPMWPADGRLTPPLAQTLRDRSFTTRQAKRFDLCISAYVSRLPTKGAGPRVRAALVSGPECRERL